MSTGTPSFAEILQATSDFQSMKVIEPLILAKQNEIRELQQRVAAESARYKAFVAAYPNGQKIVTDTLAAMAKHTNIDSVQTAPAALAIAPAAAAAPAAPASQAQAPAPQAPPAAVRAPAPITPPPVARAAAPAPVARAPQPRPTAAPRAPKAPVARAAKPAPAGPGTPRTAAATAAAAAKRQAIRAENPNYKATRSIGTRMALWEEGFRFGYQDYAENPNAQNRYAKGDRSRGWLVGATKAAEDIAARLIAPGSSVTVPPAPPQAADDYRAELIIKSPDAARDDIGSRPKLPAGVPAGEPLLETADLGPATAAEINAHFTTNEPPESVPAPHLDHWDERDTDLEFSIDRITQPPADVLGFLRTTDDEPPNDYLKN